LLIFTDLDGTLLDHDTYGWEKAKPALALCRELRVPVILVSSKTRAEMNVSRLELNLDSPFISENGGGIFFPAEGAFKPPPEARFAEGLWRWSLGISYPVLVAALHDIRDELGWAIRGFSDMTGDEIAELTGLDPAGAGLAAMREYDEPFIVSGEVRLDRKRLEEAASRRGVLVTKGGRFYHLHGASDKGEAVDKLARWFQASHGPAKTVALGDSPNDFTMLERVDYPVLVRSSRQYPELAEKIPFLIKTQERGPAGWNAAVSALLLGE